MSEFAPLKSLFESALAFGLSGTKSHFINFKLITTKNKKKKYSSRQICEIKLFNTLSLSDSLSSFFCNTGTQKAPFSKGLGVCVSVMQPSLQHVCVRVGVREVAKLANCFQPRMNPPVLPPRPVRRSRQFLNAYYGSVAPNL